MIREVPTELCTVDDRVFLLGLDGLYRDAMKEHEGTELACGVPGSFFSDLLRNVFERVAPVDLLKQEVQFEGGAGVVGAGVLIHGWVNAGSQAGGV